MCKLVRRPAPGRRPQQRQQRGRALQRAAAGQLVARHLGARGHAAREPQDAQAGRRTRVAGLQRPRRAGRQRQHCAPFKRRGVGAAVVAGCRSTPPSIPGRHAARGQSASADLLCSASTARDSSASTACHADMSLSRWPRATPFMIP